MYQDHNTDNYGAAGPAGEPGSAAPRRTRGTAGPQYTRSLLADPSIRDLVAAACSDTAADLKSDGHTDGIAGAGQRWQVSKLEAVAAELRGA